VNGIKILITFMLCNWNTYQHINVMLRKDDTIEEQLEDTKEVIRIHIYHDYFSVNDGAANSKLLIYLNNDILDYLVKM